MFPITHIYTTDKFFSSCSRFHYLGAIFPDIGIRSEISRKETHYNGMELLEYLPEKYKGFSLGYIAHGAKPRGMDYYFDEEPRPREGYAFRKSRPLIGYVMEITGLSEFLSMIRAHNFIEFAIEYLLVREYPKLLDKLDMAKSCISDEELMVLLSKYFNVDIKKDLRRYFELLPVPVDMDSACIGLSKIFKARDGIDVKKTDIEIVLGRAIEIIEKTYKSDIDEMIEKVKPTIP